MRDMLEIFKYMMNHENTYLKIDEDNCSICFDTFVYLSEEQFETLKEWLDSEDIKKR